MIPASGAARLLAFACELQRSMTIGELLAATRAEIAAEVGYRDAWLILPEPTGAGEHRWIEAGDLDDAALFRDARSVKLADDPLLEEVARTGEPVVVPDAPEDPRAAGSVTLAGRRTVILVPLRADGESIAILATGTSGADGRRPPTAAEVEQLVAMGVQIGAAAARLRRTYLHARARAREQEIAERRQAMESEMLRLAKNTAEAANAELEAFSYSVAHDLRAPLRAISGFADILLETSAGQLDDAAKQHIGRIVRAAARMGELIDALLALSRLTRTGLRRERVDLAAAADAIVEALRAAEPNRRVVFVNEGEKIAHGDPELLKVLLENLLGNAWKFTARTDPARIELGQRTTAAGSTLFFVRDNGAGFDMSYVGKLFLPFQRLHASHEFAGTGVGLATVARIVQRHGGRIWADGAVGAGATFYFALSPPLQPKPEPTMLQDHA
jgi:signal transduction histidine kinase